MKTTIFFIFLAFAAPTAFCQNTEDENLKKVIRGETSAFYNRDVDAWQTSWLHTDKISAAYVSNGSYNSFKGWDNFFAAVKDFIKKNPKQDSVDIKNDSFNITSNGNMAWVEYKQFTTTLGQDSNTTQLSREHRSEGRRHPRGWPRQHRGEHPACARRSPR